jgi:hypothetical protein
MNDYLEYILDLEQGKTNIAPDELAPEPKEPLIDGIPYDEEKDPEIEKIEEKNRLKWGHRKPKLRESIADDEAAYIASTKNPTYEGFMNSEWGNAKVTPERWKKDSTWILKRTAAGTGEMVAGTGAKSAVYAAGTGEVKQSKKDSAPGPYEEERDYGDDFENDNEVLGILSGLESKYADADLKGSADEMFQDMQNIVKNIILRRSDKRHALIWGDP